jgi:DNA-directed RNA polymerase specialized sigma24 family protein
VLVLSYLDDLPDENIAALLGRRPATIRSLRFRGLRALRDRFSADDTTELGVSRGTH